MSEETDEISLSDLSNHLRIGKDSGKLYWKDGKVQTQLSLSLIQKTVAAITLAAAVASPIILFLANFDKINVNIDKIKINLGISVPEVENLPCPAAEEIDHKKNPIDPEPTG